MKCIHNGWVLTMAPDGKVFENGYVLVEGALIVEVGEGDPPEMSFEERVNARGGIIMPGMVNAHTHIAMALFRSMADDRRDRLRKVLFPLESRAVTPELVYHASLHANLEMIRGGVTTIADMYYFEHECARATAEAGLRGVMGETIVNFPAPDAGEAYGGLAYARDFIAEWRGHALITPSVAPHAPYTVDDDRLIESADLADAEAVPMMMHLAEMPFEIEAIRNDHGVTPVRHMADIGVLRPSLVAAHCVFTDQQDRELLREHEVGVVHNITANMKGGKGVAAVPAMVEAGLRVGLGSDGPMSGNRLDILTQMREASHVHKGTGKDPTILPARVMVEMATRGGARALHMEDRIGSLEAGKEADIVVISADDPALTPIHDPWSVVVYAANADNVLHTMVAGRLIMRKRSIEHLDSERILARSRELGADLRAFVEGL
jgi:5-methylthioadenosine/S-adenosylhomocysteine deaminase